MLIERVEIRLIELPLQEPFVAAHGATTARELVVVRVDTDEGYGWGECSALPEPTYTDEFAGGAFVVLDEELGPRLIGHRMAGTEVAGRLAVVGGNPMAKAALEMALLDVECRAAATSLAARLGATRSHVPSGAAIGLAPVQGVVDRASALAAEGFGRVKVKIRPEHDLDVVEAVRTAEPDLEIQVDGNGSYGAEHLSTLIELASDGVSALEQPFPPELHRAARPRSGAESEVVAELVAASPVPIVADEAAGSLADIERLRTKGELSGVSIKPARLGGLLAAVAVHDRCMADGLVATAGGMVESGLGRHALAALAALDGFTLTGDLSPAGRWLAADPWPDLAMGDGSVEVPTGIGVAPDPDLDVLDAHTLQEAVLDRRR